MTTLYGSPKKVLWKGGDGLAFIRVKEKNPEDTKYSGEYFTVKGKNLPESPSLTICYNGSWKSNDKGKTFVVDWYEVVHTASSEKSFVDYLIALKCGFGRVKALGIWEKYHENSWRILESDPQALVGIKAGRKKITEDDVSRLTAALSESRNEREVYRLLGEKFEHNRIRRLINELTRLGVSDMVETIQTDTYSCAGALDFSMLEGLAEEFKADITDPRRLRAALYYAMSTICTRGHTCAPYQELIKEFEKTLVKYRPCQLPAGTAVSFLKEQIKEKNFIYANGFVFSAYRRDIEQGIADEINRLLARKDAPKMLDDIIAQYESKEEITLADAQKAAVKGVFFSTVNIITGGPGTGKSTITKAVLYAHKIVYGSDSEPVLLAPTGKASRRMSECNNGYPAATIHSAISYQGEKDGRMMFGSDEELHGNLFIIDEVSMMDNAICWALLSRIPKGATVVMVGDPGQLPSVGAGNVLSEMIRSEVIPVTTLKTIFRQKGGGKNPIIENAAKIRNGETQLDFSQNNFCFLSKQSGEDIKNAAIKMYLKVVEKYGIENVLLLCAYRKKGEISVNTFNREIQKTLNPYYDGCRYMSANGLQFREKDRVMQTKNTATAKNGDVGVIHQITEIKDEKGKTSTKAIIEFNEDGKMLEYGQDEIENLDLAYACTVHKSQGSEAQTVIMTVCNQNPLGLKRNLIYTGVTRAKKNVLLIGQLDSLEKGISDATTDVRYTLLGDRLHQVIQK